MRSFQSTAVRSTRYVNFSPSFRWRRTSTTLAASTSTVVSPRFSLAPRMEPETAIARLATRGLPDASVPAGPLGLAAGAGFGSGGGAGFSGSVNRFSRRSRHLAQDAHLLDLLLELHQAVEKRLGPGR